MAAGLSPSDIVNVTVSLAPTAAATRNFGALLIVGSSGVIDTAERIRSYSTMDQVALDFGSTTPEYLAAQLYFSQSPQPAILYIGGWAQGPSAGILHGGALSAANQLLTNFTAVTNGAFNVVVAGVAKTLTGVNLSTATSLAQVASLITTALGAGTLVTWDPVRSRFNLTTSTTGATSIIAFPTVPGSGTDLAPLLKFRAADGATIVNGVVAETLVNTVTNMLNAQGDWYGVMVAAQTTPTDSEYLQLAALIQSLSQKRILGVTVTSSASLDPTSTTDLGYQLMIAGYTRTFTQYASASPYVVASYFGRAFTVDFNAANSTITMKFKIEPGVVPETLSKTQADALTAKRINVFVNYANGIAIIQQGVMCAQLFFDERHNIDWYENAIQTALINQLYASTTKVPQTDAGTNQLVAAIDAVAGQAVANGMAAPGIWNAAGFGALKQGQTLPNGFYTYCPPIASQSQADREARKSPSIQHAIKLAGAVHSISLALNINR